jgi:S1-C subfamily serine protease
MKLKKRLRKLNESALRFIDKYSSKLIGALVVTIIVCSFILVEIYQSEISTPMSVKEFARTSVKITNMTMTSGGSGSIYRSNSFGTLILTNEHVCKLISNGGIVTHNGNMYLIMSYKTYKFHDLCLLRLRDNLNVNTQIAHIQPDIYDRAHISGHPALLPHVLTEGNFSGSEIVTVLTGLRPCNRNDDFFVCFILGGVPIVKRYQSQLVTGTILPGSSGSAVFNSRGQIAGVVFAGRSRELSYAYIVPYAYVNHFIRTQRFYKETVINYSTELKFKTQESVKSVCRNLPRNTIAICNNAIEILIWEL